MSLSWSTLPASLALAIACAAPDAAWAAAPGAGYDHGAALARSQAVIGRPLPDLALVDQHGRPVRLEALRGKPLLLSLIYTSCDHSCPVTTRRLRLAVEDARAALGADAFRVASVGFDARNDTPERMGVYGRQQGLDPARWLLLSGDPAAIAGLVDGTGFSAYPSPRGFDHLAQVTVVDRDGVIYSQVYGEVFELPALVEPLKELVFNRPRPGAGTVSASLLDRIKLFCTVYDPKSDKYRFDYTLLIEALIGLLVVISVSAYLFVELRRGRRR
jgi:protein SCO1/2